MITPKDDEQSILSAIDRFVACLGEDKATVATCVDHYIHLETNAAARFNIVTLRARLPVDAAKRTVNDDDLDDTNTTLNQSVPQPAAASSEDSQSPQKVQQQSPIEADPLDWDPFEVDLPPQPDRSVAHNLSSSSDDSFVHQTPDQTSSAIEERFKHYESLDYNNVPAYIDVPSSNISSSAQDTFTTSDQELTKEAEGLMCSLFDVPQDNDTALPKLCPRSSWNSISRHSVLQVDHQDSGVGVLIHSLYALAATSIPKEVDWLLWRRVLAAYKSARDSPLAAGGSSTHLTPPGDVLAQLRREHADSLGTRSGVRVPVPADSIIRRALLDDANWLSVPSGEARALDAALAELRAKLTSVPDKLKAKAHLARQTMYDINTLVAVLLGQAADKPGPASNHLENCEKDMHKIKSLIPLMRGGKMAKEKMQAALETAEGATRLAAARKAEEENNRQRSIQGLKAMQDEIQKIERELNTAGEEDSDEHQNDDKIDHNDLPGEDDEADLNDSADIDSDDDDEQPSHDEELTDDEEPSDGEEERDDALEQKTPDLTIEYSLVDAAASGSIRHLNCDVTSQADLRAVRDSISRIDKTGADAGVSGEFENFYNVFNVHIKLTKPGCGVLDANLRILPIVNKLASSLETRGEPNLITSTSVSPLPT
ncbi:hypothetical protein CGMCC3_g17625 [Colletotrichum fructicola]|nr:uncharacterized protein CGMCC3_g17625 [Colletotrichum fructicola]KAE9566214.1 hypothetical protein CGMCC3_g17625 [Colletotrichum fructicola]KAF4418493.1 hypothetical protein CFRS1_v015726 [Colletotrichum fructicola]